MRKYVKPELDVIEFGMVDIFMSGDIAPTPTETEDEKAVTDGLETVDGTEKVPDNNAGSTDPIVTPGADSTGSNENSGDIIINVTEAPPDDAGNSSPEEPPADPPTPPEEVPAEPPVNPSEDQGGVQNDAGTESALDYNVVE